MDMLHAPTLDDIEALARRAYESIPDELRRHVGDVVIRIDDFPDRETCRDMELDSEFDLLGLYQGVSLDQKEAVGSRQEINMIFLTAGLCWITGARPARNSGTSSAMC